MSFGRNAIITVVGLVIALILQTVIAPYISVFSAMPDFVAVFVMLLAVTRSQTFGPVLPFVAGLIFDLVSGGPVGGMAFSLTLCAVLTARFFNAVDNDTLFMPFLCMGLGLLFTEFIYCIVILMLGYNANPFIALFTRALPCAIYDCVIAFILYPLLMRFFVDEGPTAPPITTQFR